MAFLDRKMPLLRQTDTAKASPTGPVYNSVFVTLEGAPCLP
jgi:hypothetical protein